MIKKFVIISIIICLFVFIPKNTYGATFDGQNASWSLLFPGLGQWCQGRAGAGWIFFSTGVITLGAGILSAGSANESYSSSLGEEHYYDEKLLSYFDYLKFQRASELFFIAYGLNTIASFLNAAFYDNTKISFKKEKNNFSLSFEKKF